MSRRILKHFREGVQPVKLCPGCGHGIISGSIVRAIDALELDIDEVVFVCGRGCAGWIVYPHFSADIVQATPGEAMAYAMGIKAANPSLRVVVVSGDDDMASKGLSHLLHAARTNVDITAVCANNQICAYTGGRPSATTPVGAILRGSPKEHTDTPLDIAKTVLAAGASYVARFSVAQPRVLIKALKVALVTKGFSFVEAISCCPVHYGAMNEMATGVDMVKHLKINCVPGDLAQEPAQRGITDRIVIGEYTKK